MMFCHGRDQFLLHERSRSLLTGYCDQRWQECNRDVGLVALRFACDKSQRKSCIGKAWKNTYSPSKAWGDVTS